MGDRRNCVVKNGGDTVYLYTHWRGHELPGVVQTALKRGQDRWDDASYLARIIFCEMVKDSLMSTTGYGISSRMVDSDYEGSDVVDVPSQTVSVGDWSMPIKEWAK